MYEPYIKHEDFTVLFEDLAKLVINIIVKDDVNKILVCLVRIDNFDSDKDLRAKYGILKGVKTTDFGIDPYLSLCDPVLLVKEICKKNKI